MPVIISIAKNVILITVIYIFFTFFIIRIISVISMLVPVRTVFEGDPWDKFWDRYERMNGIVDFLCDLVYPWNWMYIPEWWERYQVWKQVKDSMKNVTLYTDGACSGNPGPGGWGAILLFGEHEKELSGGEKNTTNNRMELTAVIRGLEALKEPCVVELYSDSKYVIDALGKGWAKGWRARGWVKADKKPALNPDLWGRLLALCETHTVNLHWVKGHADNPFNNRCDKLAVSQWQKLKGQDL